MWLLDQIIFSICLHLLGEGDIFILLQQGHRVDLGLVSSVFQQG
jgi:hypothetical protein